LGSMLRFP